MPEAATDVIAHRQAKGEPWDGPCFIEDIVALQRRRQEVPVPPGVPVQVFDRSPVCTLALAWYVEQPVSDALAGEIDRIKHEDAYRSCGFSVVDVPPGSLMERAAAIDRLIRSWAGAPGRSDPGATLAR